MTTRALYPYQRHAARWLYQRKAAALFAGVGSGKTAIIAHVLKWHLDECSIRNVLLVAPIAVCKAVWRQECDEWDSLRGQLSFSLAVGTPAQRLKAIHADVDVCLINYDSLVWYLNLPDRPKFDALVLDESTNVQNASSVRFKGKGACKKRAGKELVNVPKVFGLKDRLDFDYIYLMTATPKSNKYMGLWSQSYCMDKGERLGKNITAFKKRYYYRYGPEHYHIKLRDDDAKEDIKSRLRDICYHIPRSVIAKTLPKVMVRNYFVDLPPKVWKVYKELEKDFIAQVGKNTITVDNIAIRSGKLHQVCQGTVYDDDRDPVRVHTEKMDMFSSIVEGLGDRNAFVLYNYKPTLAELRAKYPAPVISSSLSDKKYNALIDSWSERKHPIIYAHPKCLHGSTEVLTEFKGWVPITEVKITDRVFDGVEFVTHDGCVYSGYKEVIEVLGITGTPEHRLLIDGKWEKLCDLKDSKRDKRKTTLAKWPYSCVQDYSISRMYLLWRKIQDVGTACKVPQSGKICRVLSEVSGPPVLSPRNRNSYTQDMERYAFSLRPDFIQKHKLWEAWCSCVRSVERVQKSLRRYARRVFRRINYRTYRCKWPIFQRELSLGHMDGAAGEQKEQQENNVFGERDALGGILLPYKYVSWKNIQLLKAVQNNGRGGGSSKEFNIRRWGEEKKSRAQVFDLVNCGPRNRFLIRNKSGGQFVSHNSAGHGLNLQHGGHDVILFGLMWSLDLYQQVIGRLRRNGQESDTVFVHRIIARGTIEHLLMAPRLKKRSESQKDFIEHFVKYRRKAA